MNPEYDMHCMMCNLVYMKDIDTWVPQDVYDSMVGTRPSSGICHKDICMLQFSLQSTKDLSHSDFEQMVEEEFTIRDAALRDN
ncbi:MAG: hypothetical protein KJ574_00210 [Nanoarchaeota archaeon]|nr:hypothetical protein [Nanoarchaeota archaeon]